MEFEGLNDIGFFMFSKVKLYTVLEVAVGVNCIEILFPETIEQDRVVAPLLHEGVVGSTMSFGKVTNKTAVESVIAWGWVKIKV